MKTDIVLERVSRKQPLPLSVEQYRLWFLSQLEPSSIHFNINAAFRMQGELAEELFEQSLNGIVARHESLRTVFEVRESVPEQVIRERVFIPIDLVDLSMLPKEEQEARAVELMNEEIQKPFSLETGPLLRAALFRLSEQERILLFTIHHIVADFGSLGKIVQELCQFYTAYIEGRAPELAPLPLHFADYAYWQAARVKENAYERQLSYWRDKLGGELPVLNMPLDRPRPPVMTHDGERRRITLSRELTEGVKQLSRSSGVTLFNTLLAAYHVLLYRYSGQEDLCIGTSISTRSQPELQDMIGMLVNNLVLRMDVSGNPSFTDVLKLSRKTCFAAFAHQDVPYEKLIDELQSERDRSRNPFFQTMLTFLHAPPLDVHALPGLTIRRFDFTKKPSALELSFTITENDGVLEAVMDYNSDLFRADTIGRMLEHFRQLLEAAVEDPGRGINELPMLSDRERHTILQEWSGASARTAPPEGTVQELFTRQAMLTQDATALIYRDQSLTYRELEERSNQLAHALLNRAGGGEAPLERVALCLERSIEWIVTLLGVMKAGCAYIPLDPSYPSERLEYMLRHARADALIADQGLLAASERLTDQGCRVIPLSALWDELSLQPVTPVSPASNSDLMYIMYTSGSTGKPKGVMVTHRNVASHCVQAMLKFQLQAGDRVLQFTSVGFDVAVQEIFPALLSGAALVLWKDKHIAEGGEFLAWLEKEKVSVLNVTTAHWSNLVTDLKNGAATIPGSLKLVIVGGEKVAYDTYQVWSRITAGKVRWINDYGLTETTITAAMFEPPAGWTSDTELMPVGRPLGNTTIYILNDSMEPVPPGVYGELYIGGDGIAKGYWDQEELSKERFIPSPFPATSGENLFRTGDLARFLPDGLVEFMGRRDHQIKIRGFRVEPGEIEAQLSQYGKLSQYVVVPRMGPGGEYSLAAYIVLNEPTVTVGELRRFLQNRLPEYMVPSYYVVLSEIPLTVHGKVDIAALPKPERHAREERDYVAPRTPAEARAADIWAGVLGMSAVSITDSFFEIGGNSLLATQVMSQVKGQWGGSVPLRLLFEYPVLADWAEQLDRYMASEGQGTGSREEEGCLVKIQQKGEKTPLFFFHPVGGSISCYFTLSRQLGKAQPFYAFQSHGMIGSSDVPQTIEEMAEAYVSEILSVQPKGPYRLGGWSMGGFIAYEAARRLKAAGEEVVQLALIDSDLSKRSDATEEMVMYHFIKQLAAVPGHHISDDMLRSWQAQSLDREELCAELQALDLLPPGTPVEELNRLFAVYLGTVHAFQAYQPGLTPKLDVEQVQLFRAADSQEQEGVWSRLVSHLTLHQVQADHFSIVHHEDLGRWIDIPKNLLPLG
ncbi:non-ribosomal peptide synthetase [Paenibacillus algicola]|uniref:non-ribosomal peptide synthetase n=1 Tax=Paenibacillus algicola TaxID=2565926 RepID=UPI0010FCFAC3|nr:non-ribosomal peptide synthetase [Paenibacillus algicola]